MDKHANSTDSDKVSLHPHSHCCLWVSKLYSSYLKCQTVKIFLKIISSSSHNTEFPYVLCLFFILTKAINTYLFTPLQCYTHYIDQWLPMFQTRPSGPSPKTIQSKKNAKQQVDALLYTRWCGKWLVLREGKEDKQVAAAWSCHQDRKEIICEKRHRLGDTRVKAEKWRNEKCCRTGDIRVKAVKEEMNEAQEWDTQKQQLKN